MEYFHLTTPQQNIWNLQKYYGATAIANLCGAIFFSERRDGELLCKAVCRFIWSQSGIRLRFCEKNEPMQYISEEVNEEIPVMTFHSRQEFDQYAEKFAREPIGLLGRQMYRFVVFHLEKESRSGILVTLSHLISDAWTFGLMANRIDLAYRSLTEKTDTRLLCGNYMDFVRSEEQYLVSERHSKDKIYWEGKYPARPEESPVKIRSSSTDDVRAERIVRKLPSFLEQKIAVYCKKYRVTEAVLFETALVIYLARINPDIRTVTVGVPVLNRSNVREKEIAGMFVSTMPLTVTVSENMEILKLAKQITGEHMNLFRHQKYAYADILRWLREKQDFSGNLYDVMMSYQNAKTRTGADTTWYSNGCSEVPLIIHIDNRDGKDCHVINADYQTAVFRDKMEVELILNRLEYILEQIVEGTEQIRDIRIVPGQEYEKVVYEFNDTYVDYPRDKCIHELFMEQAARTPERTALVFEEKKFTYKQLDEMSNSLAYFLRAKGVRHRDRVAVLLKRDERVIIAQLAVLKLGAVFIPIDSRYPQDRVEYIIAESNARILLKNRDNRMRFPVECCVEEWNSVPVEKFDSIQFSPEEPCYAIFTSGSTGKPKGCLLTNRGIVNFCVNINILKYCNELKNRIFISVNTISFDMFILESLLPLSNGFTVVLANEEQSINREAFKALMSSSHANIIQTTPTRYKIFFDSAQDNSYTKQFDIIASSGEALPLELLRSFLENTDAKILNPMGPSECTIYIVGGEMSSLKRIPQQTDITLGKPIANTQVYILDKNDNSLPIGVPGELCIAGEGVGLGYLNRPELTAERFVPNPFAAEDNHHGKTMYRTGDLARFRSDGEIEYLGRMDTQVKIRGLRIELGEIESVMSSFPGIGLCAVADKQDETGRQYLVGYYTLAASAEGQNRVAEKGSGLDEKALRAHLSAKLPKYMVPNYFLRLDAMPMTASGKTDRKNLPVPDFTRREEGYEAPKTDTEKRLAEIWRSLLHVERAGRTDDFFELGGDSLLAISMLSEIEKEFRVEISVKDIMEQAGLAAMAKRLEDARTAAGYDKIEDDVTSRITAHHADRYPLLPQQKAIYAFCMKEPDTLAYNMSAKISLPDTVDRDRLKAAITRVMDHHRILKSCIRMEKEGLYGFYDESVRIGFEEYEAGRENAFVRPFDLGKAPLVRVGFTEEELLFDMHHIIGDGASMNILLQDIASAYRGGMLQEPETEYSDYAQYFYEQDMEEHRTYFRESLKCDMEPIALPETANQGKGGESRLYQLPEEIFAGARRYAREKGLTDTMVFLGAYGILLSRFTGRKEILSSIILQNRTHGDTRDMVGMFVNTLPVCLTLEDETTGYMQKVKEKLLGLFRYQELPFEDISEAAGIDRLAVNTSFVYQGDGEKALSLDGEELIPRFMETHTSKFDLSMELTLAGKDCRLRLEYNLGKYDGRLMDDLAEAYIRILGQLDKKRLADISALSKAEYRKIVEEFNDTYVDYPREKCVHELFMEQAARTPERTALVFEEKRFTYRQLDEMSNSLAYFLREKGVKPNDVVPIITRRSWHVIVAMLGVLKAGGAYMPIDPNYPEDRISYMLETAGSRVAVVYGCQRILNVETIELDTFAFEEDSIEIENINSSEDAAYIIFTSGSTGKPKGVTVCHRNICNYANNNNNNNNVCHKLIQERYESIVSVTNIIFDIFVTESLLPLVNGLCVYLASDKEVSSQRELSKLLAKNNVDVLQTTPTKMKSYLIDRDNTRYLKGLKAIILGGEAFPQEMYHTLRSYTDAHIYNIYGPAETTVWSTNAEVTGENITIGTPIANTQIYILNSDLRPVPIGVPGELCIAGEGVGLGYLNRPELTAERFVPNPFATEGNHHGKTMYRTGDLARFRSDGEIEYLGRMDTQVKIRGLRIELGEIESVMGSFPGIGLCAVADKRDETGRQYLVGYYTLAASTDGENRTGNGEPDEKALRAHLSAKLPKYMVPNYFLRLDAMPMTASGKTDRKNLPMPDSACRTREYVAPVTDKERELCRLMAELLHVEQVGVTDDFFELGGDSLAAIELLAKAHDSGIPFALQNIFDYPTVRQLCSHVEEGDAEKIYYQPEDFDKYRGLLAENVIDETFVPERRTLGNVLLTGATGFLGAHVLDRLLREENGKVYCLVRDGETKGGRERLREILRYYFGDRYEAEFTDGFGVESMGKSGANHREGPDTESSEERLAGMEPGQRRIRRIIPVIGDIEAEGMAENIPRDVQTVIHTAASVKHYGSYAYFHHVNVEGTRHVIQYAKSIGARTLHISTLSVSGNSLADEFAVYRSEEEKFFDESSFYIGQPLDNVYVHSKFEAEKAVFDAMLAGLDAKVVRVGNLTSRASDYKFQPNYRQNAFLTRVKAILEFGLFPDYLMHLYSEFSPVDLTAEGIVRIAQYADKQTVFHLNSNRPVYFDRFLEVVRELGIPMEVVEGTAFYQALRKTLREQGTEYIFEALQNDMDEQGRLIYDSNIHIVNDFTVWFLKQAGFAWNEIDMEYIRGYVEYFLKLGYFTIRSIDS